MRRFWRIVSRIVRALKVIGEAARSLWLLLTVIVELLQWFR